MVDLTAERKDDVQPDADAGDGKMLGHGVQMALAVLRAAPQVELVLVRIDPAAPYMLQEVARAMNGESLASESLDGRLAHFAAVRYQLDQQAVPLLEERRHVFKQFADVSQKPVLLKRRKRARLTADEEEQLKEIAGNSRITRKIRRTGTSATRSITTRWADTSSWKRTCWV